MIHPAKIKTGLFLGSFNPVHIGHTALANYILEFTDLDEIWFVVTPSNPLKESKYLIDENLRLEMVKIAITSEPRFSVSDIEFTMPKPSYTIDTLNTLKERYSERDFTIIIGGDNFVHLGKWKDPEIIINTFNVMVYPRPGYDITTSEFFSEKVSVIEAPMLDISSTVIREAVSKGKRLPYMLPHGVNEFIIQKKLYQ